jgi:hypothetical protein
LSWIRTDNCWVTTEEHACPSPFKWSIKVTNCMIAHGLLVCFVLVCPLFFLQGRWGEQVSFPSTISSSWMLKQKNDWKPTHNSLSWDMIQKYCFLLEWPPQSLTHSLKQLALGGRHGGALLAVSVSWAKSFLRLSPGWGCGSALA